MELKVGDKRKWIEGTVVFEVKAIYLTEAMVEQNGGAYPYTVYNILTYSVPYREPKPVRKLEAWEWLGGEHSVGMIELCYSDSNASQNNSSRPKTYRKLSDSELKELIKGVIGE